MHFLDPSQSNITSSPASRMAHALGMEKLPCPNLDQNSNPTSPRTGLDDLEMRLSLTELSRRSADLLFKAIKEDLDERYASFVSDLRRRDEREKLCELEAVSDRPWLENFATWREGNPEGKPEDYLRTCMQYGITANFKPVKLAK